MRFSDFRAATLLSVIGAIACGYDPVEPVGWTFTFAAASGEGQVGSAGVPLAPLSVVVTNESGAGVDGAEIVWTVSSGDGYFRVKAGGAWLLVDSYAGLTGRTDPGMATVSFVPARFGTSTVTAYGTNPRGGSLGTVDFQADVHALAILLEETADWEATWPHGPENLSVELGTLVEWHTARRCCDQVVRSISVPEGGTPFEHRYSEGDSVFAFQPDAAGVWLWAWERPGDDDWWWPSLVEDTATLVVN